MSGRGVACVAYEGDNGFVAMVADVEVTLTIPEGFVATYGDLCPEAPRFAGQVLSECHDPSVPWQRIVRSDGSKDKEFVVDVLLQTGSDGISQDSSEILADFPYLRVEDILASLVGWEVLLVACGAGVWRSRGAADGGLRPPHAADETGGDGFEEIGLEAILQSRYRRM